MSDVSSTVVGSHSPLVESQRVISRARTLMTTMGYDWSKAIDIAAESLPATPSAPVVPARTPVAVYRDICDQWVDLEDRYQELGQALKEARQRRGMSQAAAGQAVGITRDMVCLYEQGKRWKQDRPAIERLVLFLSD